MDLTIYAVGDIMLGEEPLCYNFGVKSVIKNKGVDYLFSNIKDVFKDANIVFGNLEAPISEYTDKNGFEANFFRADPSVIKGLKNAHFNVLSVANNHIMEHGERAFWFTVNSLKENNITPVGVANKAEILEINNLNIAIMAYSFIEDFIDNPAYNKISSEKKIFGDIKKIRNSVDLIILSVHWGDEFIDRPSPLQVMFAHKAIDSGANIILGHHPHVLQGIEKYHNGLIAYSLGNFIFDMSQESARKSMVLHVEVSKNGISNEKILPIYLKNDYRVDLLHDERANNLVSEIKSLSSKSIAGDLSEFDKKMLDYTVDVAIHRRQSRKELKWYFLRNLYKYPPQLILHIIRDYFNRELNAIMKTWRDKL
jgi:poly-gamma-glutamate synthesis protein (capsule biosynthesis protein)